MRNYLIVAALLCCLVTPALADDTPEATTKRVTELEKANVVLQEDLARTQLELDSAKSNLKKTQKTLDEEIALRKDLAAQLDAEVTARKTFMDSLQKQLSDEIARKVAETRTAASTDNAALSAKIEALTKALADKTESDAKEMAALHDALDKERANRLAAENDAGKARTKLAKQNNNTRTLMTVMGVVLGGIALVK